MSGNGMRCLAQAAVDAGLVAPPTFTVATAGRRAHRGATRPGRRPGGPRPTSTWDRPDSGPDQPQEFDDRRVRTVDVGNPHLVLLGPDTAGVDIAELGPQLQAAFAGRHQRRVDHVARTTRTASCSTRGSGSGGSARPWPAAPGSVAAAAAARSWGCVRADGSVRVRNPGGILEVTPAATVDRGHRVPGRARCARWPTSTSTRACCL